MIKAASLAIDVDLKAFSQLLAKQGLAHRISEESGQQVIWVASENEAEFVRRALTQWQNLPPETQTQFSESVEVKELSENGFGKKFANAVLVGIYTAPVTLILFVTCLLVALVSGLGRSISVVDFLFYPNLSVDSVSSLLISVGSLSDVAKTATPMFLHFGELHLVFNMLWLWYFGKQLESIHPSSVFLLLVLIISMISNTTQYLASESSNFGGMSGVVYGLVGYAWCIHALMPRSFLVLDRNLMAFFVVALVIMEILASSMIATGAHVGGLLTGLLIGLITVAYSRFIQKSQVVGHSS